MDEQGVVVESVAIQPDSTGPERLVLFRTKFREITSKYLSETISAFIEGYAYGANNQREALGELGGVLRISLYDDGINMVIIPPTVVKQYITGKGTADKIAMALAVMKQFGQEFPTTDQTDAFSLAVIGRAYFGLVPDLTKLRQEIIAEIKSPKVKKKRVAKK